EGDQFAGRELELEALVSRMRNRVHIVLLSPRRYGKTSLLLRAEAQLARAGPPPAVVKANVLRARDVPTLVAQLTAGAYRIPGARWHRARQAVPEFLRRLRLRPTVAFDDDGKPTFSFAADIAGPDAEQVIADLYGLLDEEAGRRPAVLILDEFQAITSHGSHLPGLLKALADAHPKVALVVAGSKGHLMERLVTSEGSPLYGMAQKLALGPIPDDVMGAFLETRARGAGKPLTPGTAVRVLDLAGPVPNDIQHLAYEAFEIAGRRIDADGLTRGLAQAVAHEASTSAEVFAARPPGQRRVLVALAVGSPDATYSAGCARAVGRAGPNS